jgi:hypothetical protein
MRCLAGPGARASAAVAALFFLTMQLAAAPAKSQPQLDGDQLLARATAAPQLQSYAVPVTFAVHLHKPIGLRSKAEGMAYFEAPAKSALTITKVSGILGGFFKGDYKLDMVPQAWPRTYHVFAVTPSVAGGMPVWLLSAQPRGASGGVAQVVFTLTRPELEPIAAQWQYQDKSSIQLTYVNGRVGPYTLPQRATVAVDMPRYKLDADATYGSYSLNAPVPDTVFSGAK